MVHTLLSSSWQSHAMGVWAEEFGPCLMAALISILSTGGRYQPGISLWNIQVGSLLWDGRVQVLMVTCNFIITPALLLLWDPELSCVLCPVSWLDLGNVFASVSCECFLSLSSLVAHGDNWSCPWAGMVHIPLPMWSHGCLQVCVLSLTCHQSQSNGMHDPIQK